MVSISDPGGTGKSQVIHAVQHWYKTLGRSDEIVVTATTGAAASNIGGSIIYSAANLPVKGRRISKKKKDQTEKLWRTRK